MTRNANDAKGSKGKAWFEIHRRDAESAAGFQLLKPSRLRCRMLVGRFGNPPQTRNAMPRYNSRDKICEEGV